jgi:hypothetical protein
VYVCVLGKFVGKKEERKRKDERLGWDVGALIGGHGLLGDVYRQPSHAAAQPWPRGRGAVSLARTKRGESAI